MLKELELVRQEAKNLVGIQSQPLFYERFSAELAFSKELFFDHPLVVRCCEDVLPFLSDEYGHGIDHAKKVALEAGAISLAEAQPFGMNQARHLCMLSQLSGLMHDICRLEPEHALRGGELSLQILHDYPLTDRDKSMVAFSIRSHEAFRPKEVTDDPMEEIVASALYDADKFRWGPDNFGTTLWEICDYEEWCMREILSKFPAGVERIRAIANTFRSEVGRTFGPEFIELGIQLGNRLYTILQQHVPSPDRGETTARS
ncbi:hypothetical protein SAMN05660653_00211 [Desulfonatronum thiosulfatophilum]|uniref:HD domain-containing protein n=1 Tax=Desulfonatronum thiosulfatophilum TaxID=617002 RepID=A0A1G6A7L3_9BACT|nr:hypothetical protein [Desulfonatronum thiosulfatophilum]SDB04424.1 hypothetical protein SAMN05660653_00211 [Desulfonatronum thiosulfatophilum]